MPQFGDHMSNATLTVFVCGTQLDLADERNGALEAIRRLKLQHDSMEYFGARNDTPIETCLQEVRRSNIIIVIVGMRYGAIVPGMNISYTQAEYDEAYRLKKTCLVYFRDDNVPVLPKYFENNPENFQRLQEFKKTLGQRHTAAKFRDANDLALQVAADLGRTVQTLEKALESQNEQAPLRPETAAQQIGQIVREALDNGVAERSAVSVVRRAMSNLLLTEGLRRPIVFLSHSHRDSEIVTALGHALRAEGADPWVDTEQLKFGDSLVDKIQEGLDSSDAIAVFVSGQLGAWQNSELGYVWQNRLSGHGPLAVAVLIGEGEIPALLRDTQYFDLRDGDTRGVAQGIVAAIRRNVY